MADNYGKLLTFIIDHPLLDSERTEAEIDASAVVDTDEEVNQIHEDLHADAEQMEPSFREGLQRAIAAGGHLEVDDTTPEGDAIASAMVAYLVRTNLATSESTDLPDGHYKYKFDVDLAKLRNVASSAGVEL